MGKSFMKAVSAWIECFHTNDLIYLCIVVETDAKESSLSFRLLERVKSLASLSHGHGSLSGGEKNLFFHHLLFPYLLAEAANTREHE